MVAEVMTLLEAEPATSTHCVLTAIASGPDIPSLLKQLVILSLTGKAKEAIGVQLAHVEQVTEALGCKRR